MNDEILHRAKHWATSNEFDADTRHEIATLLEENNEKELTDRFYRDLEFGTGGMRGIMGAGSCRMNIYNIRKATFALGSYLREVHGESVSLKVAISRDSRNNGPTFVEAAAEVLAALGIEVLVTEDMRPTPMLSFMVRHFGCQGGICVTASHNPPSYNGYKVYWSTGGQLTPPHDANIVKRYKEVTSYSEIPRLDYEQAKENGLVKEIGSELDDPYHQEVSALALNREDKEDIKIVYSSLHGTGVKAVPRALTEFGFDQVFLVPEQEKPDGNFPTVKSPNPEDQDALTLALKLGREKQADIVMATDPDTDRIGMYALENGEFTWFNGNQLGCLLVEYTLASHKKAGTIPDDGIVIKTIVTTELQKDIATHYGVDCRDTLTGFKWICGLIEDFESGKEKPYRRFICGGEESYGFLAGNFVRDKDAVVACSVAAEMVAHYKKHGKTLSQVLDEMYLRHGVYYESLHTITLPGKEGADRIAAMMQGMREHPPGSLVGHRIVKMNDIKVDKSFEVSSEGMKDAGDLGLPSSNVLQFFTDDGIKVSVRPSGTEPKIKFYTSVRFDLDNPKDLENLKKKARETVAQVEDAFIELVNS